MDEKYADSGSLVFTKLNINNQGRDNNFEGGNESNAATKKLRNIFRKKILKIEVSSQREFN